MTKDLNDRLTYCLKSIRYYSPEQLGYAWEKVLQVYSANEPPTTKQDTIAKIFESPDFYLGMAQGYDKGDDGHWNFPVNFHKHY